MGGGDEGNGEILTPGEKGRTSHSSSRRWTINSHTETWGLIYPLFPPGLRGQIVTRQSTSGAGQRREVWTQELANQRKSAAEWGREKIRAPAITVPVTRKWSPGQMKVWCSSPLSQKELISHQINQLMPVDEPSHTSVGSSHAAHLSALKLHHINSQADAKLDGNSWFTQCWLGIHS